MFHNFRRNYSHHIMQEIDEFDQNINLISNAILKYLAFIYKKTFIDSVQFMNSSLELWKRAS